MSDYGISATNWNPLGSFGLNTGGMFGSYADPYSMSMMSPYGMGMYGMGGMMSMYPQMITQMTQAQQIQQQGQQQMERSQLEHSTTMHDLIQQAEVEHLSAHDRAIFEKAMVDGDVKEGIRTLHDVIIKGDSDAACMQFDKLKQTIYTKYNDYFRAKDGKMNTTANVNNLISMIYTELVSKQAGAVVDLRSDINKYCESAWQHGFNKTFLGSKGHNQKNAEETIAYMSGTRINDEGKKKRAEELGGYAARGAEGAAAMGVGAVAGITTLGIGKWLKSMFTPSAMRNGQSAMDKAAAAAAEQVKKNLATSATDKAVKSAVDAAVQGITDNTVKNAARKAAEEAAKDVAKRPGLWNGIKQSMGSWGTWAKIGAVAFVVGDIIWQMSRDDK